MSEINGHSFHHLGINNLPSSLPSMIGVLPNQQTKISTCIYHGNTSTVTLLTPHALVAACSAAAAQQETKLPLIGVVQINGNNSTTSSFDSLPTFLPHCATLWDVV